MKNPYDILGLDASVTFEEAEAKYKALKAEYSEGRFMPGAEGAEAARKLTELENAWAEIQSKAKVEKETESGNDYEYIDRLIKDGKYDAAQSILDGISVREGEWHYYQSIIYYKREWLSECKKQLEAAVACDPDNYKYRSALDKLNLVIGNANADPNKMGRENMHQQYVEEDYPHHQGDALSNCCQAYCCASMCCDCMRCCM